METNDQQQIKRLLEALTEREASLQRLESKLLDAATMQEICLALLEKLRMKLKPSDISNILSAYRHIGGSSSFQTRLKSLLDETAREREMKRNRPD